MKSHEIKTMMHMISQNVMRKDSDPENVSAFIDDLYSTMANIVDHQNYNERDAARLLSIAEKIDVHKKTLNDRAGFSD